MAFDLFNIGKALLGIWGSSEESRAKERALEEQMAFLRPYLAARWAALQERQGMLRAMREAIEPQLGKPSPRLKAAYESSMSGIARAEQTALRTAAARLGERGREEAEPGVRWGIRMGAERVRGEKTLGYASAEESRQQQLLQMLGGIAQAVLGGEIGPGEMAAFEAIGAKGQARAEKYGSLGGLFGKIIGDIEFEKLMKETSAAPEAEAENVSAEIEALVGEKMPRTKTPSTIPTPRPQVQLGIPGESTEKPSSSPPTLLQDGPESLYEAMRDKLTPGRKRRRRGSWGQGARLDVYDLISMGEPFIGG